MRIGWIGSWHSCASTACLSIGFFLRRVFSHCTAARRKVKLSEHHGLCRDVIAEDAVVLHKDDRRLEFQQQVFDLHA